MFSTLYTIYCQTRINACITKQRICQRAMSKLVLGIESTFDDTGVALVDEQGEIIGESLLIQKNEHLRKGGVDPLVAAKHHRHNLPIAVDEAIKTANVKFEDLSAVATATRPGLALCLNEGLEYSKSLIQQHNINFIPVHHMEAHLLTARMTQYVPFPFLTLLVSGGHCILCFARDLGDYVILGRNLDEPPGAVFDKVARAFTKSQDYLPNGSYVEELAKRGDRETRLFTVPFSNSSKRTCDFSFSGLQTQTLRLIEASPESKHATIAWSFQHTVTSHIITQLHRAMLYMQACDWLQGRHVRLVVSGGVACNQFLRRNVQHLCDVMEWGEVVFPPASLCTDNGVMIAWAGMEYLKAGRGISDDPMLEKYQPKCALGRDASCDVKRMYIRVPRGFDLVD